MFRAVGAIATYCVFLLFFTGVSEAHNGVRVQAPSRLGVPGFPDCRPRRGYVPGADVAKNARNLECFQRKLDSDAQLSVGCVGDSITAGVHSSGGNMTYPAQLQRILGDKFKVTNMGACGSTMMKGADSPYWQRPQYQTLTSNKWDAIVIQLGTNDAKDKGSKGPPNWPHNCTGPDALTCPYAVDYAAMIKLVRTLGPKDGVPPRIFLSVPPPLMQDTVYGMNETVINEVLPELIPRIAEANGIPKENIIDVFSALGGRDYKSFPAGGCTLENVATVPNCKWYCSENEAWHCDQCHPDDDGYGVIAKTVGTFILTEEEGISVFSIMLIASACIAAGAAVSALCIFVVVPRCQDGELPSFSCNDSCCCCCDRGDGSGMNEDYSSAPITLGYTSIS